jgi:broad specificity phosphatase PhoE
MKIDVDFGISENISNDIFYGISGMNISEIWEQSIAYLDESDRQMLNLSYEGEYKTISIETDEQYNQRIISSMKRIINKNSMNNLIITHSYALRCFDMQDMRYGDVMKVCSNFEVNVQKIVKDPQQIGGNNSIDRYNINRMLFLWLESNF